MKKLYMALFLLFSGSIAYSQFPAPYCGPLVFPSDVEPITMVNFAGINNTTSAAVSSADHENFIVQTANVAAGQTYPISLKGMGLKPVFQTGEPGWIKNPVSGVPTLFKSSVI